MPDWTYHPAYRPFVFRLPAEDARRLTMALLAMQSRTRPGRELFRLLSYGLASGHAHAFGLTFPSRFGLGPDIDTDARAFGVLQYLGCGFLTAGPTCLGGRPRVRSFDCQRVPGRHALTRSTRCCAPSAAALRARLDRRDVIHVPVGVTIDDAAPGPVISVLDDRADFFSLRGRAAAALAEARAATRRPILLRVPLDGGVEHAVAEARRAEAAGLNGVVLGDGEDDVGSGELFVDGAGSLAQVLLNVAGVRAAMEKRFAVVAAGGVITPPDAIACVRAGADLVEIATGFVYSGPGLIGRIVALGGDAVKPGAAAPASGAEAPVAAVARDRAPDVLVAAWSGLLACAALACIALPADLLARTADRWPLLLAPAAASRPLVAAAIFAALSAMGGALAALARRGETWTSWLLTISAAVATPLAPAVGAAGLALVAVGELHSAWFRRGFRPLFGPTPGAWGWSAANLGKRVLQAGVALVVAVVLAADAPGVLRLSAAGAAVCTLVLVGRGLRPGVRAVWVTLAVCAVIQLAVALMLATQGWQRIAVCAATLSAGAGLLWLWGPLVQLDEGLAQFPDV